MLAGFDELIAYLLDEISFCGTRGISSADFCALVTAFGKRQKGGDTSASPSSHGTPQPDRRLLEKVWTWLVDHADIVVGDHGQWNHLSLTEFEQLEKNHIAASQDADQDGASDARVYTTADRMWQAVAGHGSDSKLIPPLEFQALCIIASCREAGIVQPELVRLTGQDKRSLPKRTDVLAARGYIEKVPIFIRKHKTSLLRHKRYAKAQTGIWSPSGVRNYPFEDLHFDLDSFVNILLDKIKDGGIITMQDFYLAIGVEQNDIWKQRTTRRMLDILQELGIIARFRAPCGVPMRDTRYIPCIKLLRPPTDDDRRRAFRDKKHGSFEAASSVLPGDMESQSGAFTTAQSRGVVNPDMNTAQAALNGSNEASGLVRGLDHTDQAFDDNEENHDSVWDPDVPYLSAIYHAVDNSGSHGIGSTELRAKTFGITYLRPVESIMGRLSDTWEISQPPQLRHLAIIRDATLVDRNAQYQYHSYPGFEQAVKEGSVAWEAVLGKQKSVSKIAKTKLDAFGFVDINRNQLVNRTGSLTLSEMMTDAKVSRQELMTRDPRVVKNSDNLQRVIFERVDTAPVLEVKSVVKRPAPKAKAPAKPKQQSATQDTDVPMIAGLPAAEYRKRYQVMYQARRLERERLPQIKRYATWIAMREAVKAFNDKVARGQINDLILPDKEVQELLAERASKSTPRSQMVVHDHAFAAPEIDAVATTSMESTARSVDAAAAVSDAFARPSRKRKATERAIALLEVARPKRRKLKDCDDGTNTAVKSIDTLNGSQIIATEAATSETLRLADHVAAQGEQLLTERKHTIAWMKPVVPSAARVEELMKTLSDSTKPGVHVQPVGSRPAYAASRQAAPSLVVSFKFEWLRRVEWFVAGSHIAQNAPRAAASVEKDNLTADEGRIESIQEIFEDSHDEEAGSSLAASPNGADEGAGRQTVATEDQAIRSPDRSVTSELTKTRRNLHESARQSKQLADERQSLLLKLVVPAAALSSLVESHIDSLDTTVATKAGRNDQQPASSTNLAVISMSNTAVGRLSTDKAIEKSHIASDNNPSQTNASDAKTPPNAKSENSPSTTQLPKALHGYTERYARTPSKYLDWNVREVAKRDRVTARKKGVQLGGGSSRFRKSQIIMDVLDSCEGVIGGDNEIIRPYRALYSSRYGTKHMPDRDTITKAVKNLADQGKIKRVAFIFQSENGKTITRHLLMRPDVDFSSSAAQKMVENIKDTYPRQYTPPHLDVGEENTHKQPEVRFKHIDESVQVLPGAVAEDGPLIGAEAPWAAQFESRRKAMEAARFAEFAPDQARRNRQGASDDSEMPAKKPRMVYSSSAFSSMRYLYNRMRMKQKDESRRATIDAPPEGATAAAHRIGLQMALEEASVPGRTVFSKDMGILATTPWTSNHETAVEVASYSAEHQRSIRAPVTTSTPMISDQDDGAQEGDTSRKRNTESRTARVALKGFRSRLLRPSQSFNMFSGTFSTNFCVAHWTWPYYCHVRSWASEVPKTTTMSSSSRASDDGDRLRVPQHSSTTAIDSIRLESFSQIEAEVHSWRQYGHNLTVEANNSSNFVNYALNHGHHAPVWDSDGPQKLARKFTHYSIDPEQSASRLANELFRPQARTTDHQRNPQNARAESNQSIRESRSRTVHNAVKIRGRPAPKASSNTAMAMGAASPPVSERSWNKDKKVLRNTECGIDITASKSLLYAVVIVRTLAGGLDRTIKWKIIDELFKEHPNYCQISFKNRWHHMHKTRPDIVDKLQDDFENEFLNAYEHGFLPPYDLSSLDTYDWAGILTWAMRTIRVIEDSDDMAISNFYNDKFHISAETADSGLLREDYLRPFNTTIRRMYAINSMDVSLSLRQKQFATDFMLARSWARCAVSEVEHISKNKTALRRLQSLDDNLLQQAIQSLLDDKVIVSKSRKFGPFDSNDQLPVLVSARPYQHDNFMEGVKHKDAIDGALKSGQPSFAISQASTTSQVMAVSEMLLNQRIATNCVLPEINNTLGHTESRISVWGLSDGSYQSRKVDSDTMFWPLEIIPTNTYQYGWPILNTVRGTPIPLRPFEDPVDRARIPYWSTFDGKLIFDKWQCVILVVVQSLAQRAGFDAATLGLSLKHNLEAWEIDLALQWLGSIGVTRKVLGSWCASEWWWMVLPCLASLDPKTEQLSMQM